MRKAGVEAIIEADELSIVGVLEIGLALPVFVRALRKLSRAAGERRPDVVILVDFPEFNLKLARRLKRLGLTVVYYISPQVWAWRQYRVKALQKYVDLLLTILPFEQAWLAERGFTSVKYVGNPLAEEVAPTRDRSQFTADHQLDPVRPIVALLPGSRHKEITRILPVMLRSAQAIRLRQPECQFVIATRSGKNRSDVEGIVRGFDAAGIDLRVSVDATYDALAASDAAIVTSGTATLEAGIIGTPMVIVYRTSRLNYLLLRPLVDIENFGLINLIAGRPVAKEMLQDEFEPDAVCSEVIRLLEPAENQRQRELLHEAASQLGKAGGSDRAAQAVIDLLKEKGMIADG